MMRSYRMCLLIVLFVIAVLPANAQDPLKGLKDYLKQYGYQTLVPPMANVAVGSVVTFDHRVETVVSSKCLPAASVPPSPPQPIGLTIRTGTYTRTIGIDASFSKSTGPNIDISGAFSDARVQSVTITMTQPTETHLESQDARQFISNLPDTDPCKATLTNKKNLIYQSLIKDDKISYVFSDKYGKTIKLDVALLSALKVDPSYQSDLENKDSLDMQTPLYVGYRAWKVRSIPALVHPEVALDLQKPAAIRAMKQGH